MHKLTIKKITALSFFIVLIFAFSSCMSSPDSEVFDVPVEGFDSSNLSGYSCIILQHESTDLSGMVISNENPFGYADTSIFADDILKRIADTEAETGCDIILKTTNQDAVGMSAVIVAADVYEGEILFSASRSVTQSFASQGALIPIQDLSEIDLSDYDKWGGANVYEINAINGNVYGVCPMYWLFKQPRSISTIVVNDNLVKRFGLDSIGEYVENGNWTWESFEHILRNYTVLDGETTYYALACRFFDFVKLAFLGNGCKTTGLDENGNVINGMENENAIEAFSWARKIAIEYGDCLEYGTRANDWPDTTSSFISNKSIMLLTAPTFVFSAVSYEIEGFSIFPFPVGPQGVQGQWPSVLENAENFGVIFNAKEPEAAAFIINKLCEPMESFSTYDDMVDYLVSNVLYNKSDAETILNIHKYGEYSYWNGTNVDSFWRAFQDDGIVNRTPAEIVSSHINTVKGVIERNIQGNLSLYEEFPVG